MSAHTSAPNKPFRISSARTLGAAIRHYRTTSGISQTELAARTGIPRNYVNALENGHDTEYVIRVLAIFRELGLRLNVEREAQ